MIIRESTYFDAAGIARVHVDCWRTAYRGIVSDDYLDELSYEKVMEHCVSIFRDGNSTIFSYVAEKESQIIGFAAGGPEQTGNSVFRGELYALYIHPRYQRKGIGRRLVQVVAERLTVLGIDSMLAWVLADNPNRKFYETLGGSEIEKKMLEIGGIYYDEVAFGWDDTKLLLLK